MRERVWRFCRVAALVSSMAGCGSSSTSSGSPFTLTGVWQGTATGANQEIVAITLDLTQVDSTISGTFTCAPSATNCTHNNGTISGSVRLNELTAGIVFDDLTPCESFDATVTRVTDSMSGTFSCALATGATSGTWTATRQ